MNKSKHTYRVRALRAITTHAKTPSGEIGVPGYEWSPSQVESTKTAALYVAAMMLNEDDVIEVSITKSDKA